MSFIKLFSPPESSPTAASVNRPNLGRFILSVHVLSVTLISCAIAFTSAIFLIQLCHETEQRAYATLERRIQVFRQLLDNEGEIRVSGGSMMAGGTVLNGNFDVPDKIKEIFDATAVIFMGDTAISTNVVTGKGERALRARLTNAPHDAIFKDNRRFMGEADISGIRHLLVYDPIRDSNGSPVGALHVAIPKRDFFADYEKRRTEVILTAILVDIIFILLSITIIRQRKKHMDTLHRSEALQQAILDNIPDLVWMKDLDGRFIVVNEAFAAVCGSTPAEVVGKNDLDLWPPDLASQYRKDDRRVAETKEKKIVEEYLEDAGGKRYWIETIKTPIYKDGVVIGTTGIARDIDTRKQGEAALRESEERFHEFFTQNWDAVMLLSQNTMEVVDANPAMVDLFGYEVKELRELGPLRVIGPESLLAFSALLQDVARMKDSIIDHAEGAGKDGRKIELSIRAQLIRFRQESVVYCSFRDITERMRLEAEQQEVQSRLIQANKMTSLGMLVSGIAHEINNPNQFITINASLMAEIWRHAVPVLDAYQAEHGDFVLKGLPYAQIRETTPRLIIGIEEGAQRINSIIKSLKEFVRDSSAQNQEAFDLHGVVHAAVMILTHAIHKHTDYFSLDLEEGLPRVMGKPQLIEQVVINLLSNALEALPGKDRGVRVSSRYDRESGLVILSVIDEGKGMERAVLERITEPFYSTRLDEGGTGLGVSISASIIKEHGGTLDFASSPGVGTAATITLRAAGRPGPVEAAGVAAVDRETGGYT